MRPSGPHVNTSPWIAFMAMALFLTWVLTAPTALHVMRLVLPTIKFYNHRSCVCIHVQPVHKHTCTHTHTNTLIVLHSSSHYIHHTHIHMYTHQPYIT